MKIAILTTQNQWFERYAIDLSKKLKCALYFNYNNIKNFDIVFILSYHTIIPKNNLRKNKHNIVIHESNLPKGKGWSPLFWQVLEDKKEIPFTMFEASDGVDNGDIYMKKTLKLTGNELNEELREKQAQHTIEMCKEFINNYEQYKIPTPQIGDEDFYPKRTAKDSKLDINKTIKEEFNLLRTVNNDEYPAFFEIDGDRYILKIELDNGGGLELIDFVDLNNVEKKDILNLRNNNDIKKWMYNQDNISLDNHLMFIKSLELNPFQQNIMVKKDTKFIGVVYFIFDYKKSEVLFGLYANIYERIAGLGRILEEVCIKYSFDLMKIKKLKLEVFSDNKQAINLYKKFDFQEVSKKYINNKEVICMELSTI
jgi:UDP-4-amino-4,6-dideoxy-N-acetyl-beta-L-altrosamine N-acetyltransferase